MKAALVSLPAVALAAAIVPRDPPAPASAGPFGGLVSILKGGGVPALIKALPVARLDGVKELQAKVRPGAKRTIARFGPYHLAGKDETKPPNPLTASLDPHGQAWMDLNDNGLCKNCTILAGKTNLQFADGSAAGPKQGVYLHHIVSRDIARPPALPLTKCPGRPDFGAEFLAQGDDGLGEGSVMFTSQDGKFNSGFHMGPNAKIMSQIDLVNLNEKPQDVFVTYEIEYVDGLQGADASATLMSVTECNKIPGGHGDHPDPSAGIKLDKNGPASTDSPKFPFTRDGQIVAAFGHMHDGGEGMALYINDKLVCDAKAVYKGEAVDHIRPCPGFIPFKKGDVLTMKSVYDLKAHPLRAGAEHNAMGMADVMGMFYLTLASN